MREIVLDTETTGLDPYSGHRIVEIGCVEIFNKVSTGNTFHVYINPERDMPAEAEAVHGLSSDFLSKYAPFREVVGDFLDFIGDDILVIHDADFDMKFINAELEWQKRERLPATQAFDTLKLARQTYPGMANSLDALCRRLNVDNSGRDLHGALLDAQLLAQVYLELCGGAQPDFVVDASSEGDAATSTSGALRRDRPLQEPRDFPLDAAEAARHQEFLEKLTDPIWLNPKD